MANVRRATIYVDSSSTDKGAADKTDEVYLEVLCLTGEGVTLSVPRSILGYDLRRFGVREASMEARRKARHASRESKAQPRSNLERARDC